MSRTSLRGRILDVAYGAHGLMGLLAGSFLLLGLIGYLRDGNFELEALAIVALMWTLFLPGILMIVATLASLASLRSLVPTLFLLAFAFGVDREITAIVLPYPPVAIVAAVWWFRRGRTYTTWQKP